MVRMYKVSDVVDVVKQDFEILVRMSTLTNLQRAFIVFTFDIRTRALCRA